MKLSPSLLQRLSTIEMPAKVFRQIIAVLSEYEEGRSPAAVRQQRYRDKLRNENITSDVTRDATNDVTDLSPEVPPKNNIKPLPTPNPSSHPSDVRSAGEPAPKKSERKTPVAEIREILETCLPSQLAQDLIEHRKAKRSPLTTGAARLLAKQFTDFGQPVLAAQTMIARGWQGFKPEWMANDARAGPSQQPTRNGMHAVHAKLHGLDRSRHDEPDFENPFSPAAGASQPGNIKSGRGLPEPDRDELGGEVVDLVKEGTTWG